MLLRLLVLFMLSACHPILAAEAASGQSAQTMWMLNCQGCHRADGAGTDGAVPALPGIVARFLSAPGGREYLIRVPGVAASPLADDSLAVLVNWMLENFDRENIPADFTPYTREEIARFRKLGAYGTEASSVRATLLGSIPPAAAVND